MQELGACSSGQQCNASIEGDDSRLLQQRLHHHAGSSAWSTGHHTQTSDSLSMDKPCSSYSECLQEYKSGMRHMLLQEKLAQVSSSSSCDLTDPASNGCPLANMPLNQSSYVLPGGKTACVNASAPFRFQVIPGDSDKLLFYFQSGGACFNYETTVKDPQCRTETKPADPVGIFNRSNPSNPFATYTVVVVLSCDGSSYAGNVTRDYLDPTTNETVSVVQNGYWNTKAALDWTLVQIPTLRYFVVAGCSAGALGMQLWARTLLGSFADRVTGTIGAIADSYLGILPPQIPAGLLMLEYGACTVPLWTPQLLQSCLQGTASPDAAYVDAMQEFPDTAFAIITGKQDRTQVRYYNLFASSQGLPTITGEEYMVKANQLLDRLNTQANLVTYLIDSSEHCWLPKDYFYTSDTRGETGALQPPPEECATCGKGSRVHCPVSHHRCSSDECCPRTPGLVGGLTFPCPSAPNGFNGCEYEFKARNCLSPPPPLVEWVGRFPVPDCGMVASECSGVILREENWTGTDYCSATQAGKVVVKRGAYC